MGDRDDRAGVVLEKPLEPGDRFGVEMVGRLVEQQQVGRLQQQPAQRDAAAFAAGERRDLGVGRRQPQRVHRELEPRVEIPRVRRVDLVLDLRLLVEHLVHLVRRQIFAELRVHLVVAREQRLGLGDAFLDVAEHGLRRIEPRLLVQEADRDAVAGKRFADEALILAGHDRSSELLPAPFRPSTPIFAPEQKRQPDVFEHFGVGRMHLPETLHGVDELGHR